MRRITFLIQLSIFALVGNLSAGIGNGEQSVDTDIIEVFVSGSVLDPGVKEIDDVNSTLWHVYQISSISQTWNWQTIYLRRQDSNGERETEIIILRERSERIDIEHLKEKLRSIPIEKGDLVFFPQRVC